MDFLMWTIESVFPSLFGPVDPKLVQEFSPYGIIYEGTSGSWLIDLTKMPVALQTAAQTSKAMIVNQFDPNDFVGLPGLMMEDTDPFWQTAAGATAFALYYGRNPMDPLTDGGGGAYLRIPTDEEKKGMNLFGIGFLPWNVVQLTKYDIDSYIPDTGGYSKIYSPNSLSMRNIKNNGLTVAKIALMVGTTYLLIRKVKGKGKLRV